MIAIKYLHMPSEKVARFLVRSGLARLLPMRGYPSLVVRTVQDVEFYDKANGVMRRYAAGEYFVSFEECVSSRLFGLLWDPNDAIEAIRAEHPDEWTVFDLYFEYVAGFYAWDAGYIAMCAEMDAERQSAWLACKEEEARWAPDRIDRTVAEASEDELRRHVSNYEVWEPECTESRKAVVVTAQCQYGGCATEELGFDTYRDALAEAARREALGIMPAKDVCPECAAEYEDW